MPEVKEKKRSLIEISNDLLALEELLIETGGDISDEQVAEAVEAWFAEFESDLDTKTDNYVALIRSKELTAAMAKEEAERLMKRAQVEANQVKGLKDRLKFALERLGKKKAGKVRTATVAGNGGKQPIQIDDVALVDLNNVPARLQKITWRMSGDLFVEVLRAAHAAGIDVPPFDAALDEQAVRAALEAGEELPFARFTERGSHLRIK